MNPAFIVQLVIAGLQVLPIGVSTAQSIKRLLATDPAMPADLSKILLETSSDNSATLSSVQAWLTAHPEVKP